jgi:hypothetical protein
VVAVGQGTITTVAGDGTAGFSGDGGPATSAQLNFTYGVAEPPDGGFLISDTGNSRIRKVAGTPVDTTAPDTQIDSGPAGVTNNSSPSFAFSSEPGASFECRIDSSQETDFQPCTSPKSYSSLLAPEKASSAAHGASRPTPRAGSTSPTPATAGSRSSAGLGIDLLD